jgi:hypothetical protein
MSSSLAHPFNLAAWGVIIAFIGALLIAASVVATIISLLHQTS